jgi:hypothetical protein
MNKNRWLFYILFGILFGVFDFYYQMPMQHIESSLLRLVAILGIWLVLAVPVAINEVRVTGSAWKAALASLVSWIAAVISYYLFMMVKLVFIGEPSRPEMHFRSRTTDPYYWENLKSVLQYDILGGVGEWILVAIVGGTIVGYLSGFIYLKTKQPEEAPSKLNTYS